MLQQEVKSFSELGIKIEKKRFVGQKVRLGNYLNQEILIHDYSIDPSKYPKPGAENVMCLQISVEGIKYVSFTIAKTLMLVMDKVPRDNLPFKTKIINNNGHYEFT